MIKYINEVIKTSRIWMFFLFASEIINIICVILEVISLQKLIQSFLNGMTVNYYAVIILFIYSWRYLSSSVIGFIKDRLSIRYKNVLEYQLYEKISKIKLEYFEDVDTINIIHRSLSDPVSHIVNALYSILSIISGCVSTISVLVIISQAGFHYILGIIVLIFFMIFIFQYIGKMKAKVFNARNELTRRETYLSDLLFNRELAMEKKLFDYKDFIQAKIRKEILINEKPLQKSLLKHKIVVLAYDYIVYLFSASAYFFLLFPLVEGKIDVGLYIAIIPALFHIGGFLVGLLDRELSGLKAEKNFCDDLNYIIDFEEQFYEYKAENKDEKLADFCKIEIKNATFTYPNSDMLVIKNLNLVLEKGKHYALIGQNGAGKTTLVKLILGLYKLSEGEILIDNININSMSFGEIQQKFSVIFQDFGRYEISIKDNILLDNGLDSYSSERLEQVCMQAGIHELIGKLPLQYNTLLGKLYEKGVDISGGQWQKLACARMFYHEKPFYILDEPTSALDPISESDMYKNYMEFLKESSTSIFISHRLGSTMLADEIIVLEEGEIKEKGSHNELVNKKGIYYDMFHAQRGLYL